MHQLTTAPTCVGTPPAAATRMWWTRASACPPSPAMPLLPSWQRRPWPRAGARHAWHVAEHSRLLHRAAALSRWWLAALAAGMLVHCWATVRANGGKATGRAEHCLVAEAPFATQILCSRPPSLPLPQHRRCDCAGAEAQVIEWAATYAATAGHVSSPAAAPVAADCTQGRATAVHRCDRDPHLPPLPSGQQRPPRPRTLKE